MPIYEDKSFKDYINSLPAATENDLSAGNNMPVVSASDIKKMGGENVEKKSYAIKDNVAAIDGGYFRSKLFSSDSAFSGISSDELGFVWGEATQVDCDEEAIRIAYYKDDTLLWQQQSVSRNENGYFNVLVLYIASRDTNKIKFFKANSKQKIAGNLYKIDYVLGSKSIEKKVDELTHELNGDFYVQDSFNSELSAEGIPIEKLGFVGGEYVLGRNIYIDLDKSIGEICIGYLDENRTLVWQQNPVARGANGYFLVGATYSAASATKYIRVKKKNNVGAIGSRVSYVNVNAYITCWGDSLTAMGGWTKRLQDLSGIEVYNGGTGGESVYTIAARQGGDAMVVDNLVIPAATTSVKIADNADGIKTMLGFTARPLMQSSPHFNPCNIGGVEGSLAWDGNKWDFTRSESGIQVTIDRPTAIVTNYDKKYNAPKLMIIYMGQNGGYTDNKDLIAKHRWMIEHSKCRNFVVLGMSSGTAASRADYESAMRNEFGRLFISLREYLAHPIYTDGVVTSCYGLADAGMTPTADDLAKIAIGQVPSQLLIDSVHYKDVTRTIIGNLIYKRCVELNIL